MQFVSICLIKQLTAIGSVLPHVVIPGIDYVIRPSQRLVFEQCFFQMTNFAQKDRFCKKQKTNIVQVQFTFSSM